MEKENTISLKDTREASCSCGHALFKQLISMRELSPLLSGTGKAEYIPVAVIVCNACGKVFERNKLIV